MVYKKKTNPYFDKKAAKELSGAIIKNAVNDYMDAILQDDKVLIADCEKFFRSEDGWFDWLSEGLDGEALMHIVRTKINKFLKACECHQPEKYGDKKAAKEASFTCPCCESTPVTIVYDRRNAAFRQCLQYTCSTCHISLRLIWHGSVLPRDFNCNNCGNSVYSEDNYTLFCKKYGKLIRRLSFDCGDWTNRKDEKEETD